jgi:hypothetical protein
LEKNRCCDSLLWRYCCLLRVLPIPIFFFCIFSTDCLLRVVDLLCTTSDNFNISLLCFPSVLSQGPALVSITKDASGREVMNATLPSGAGNSHTLAPRSLKIAQLSAVVASVLTYFHTVNDVFSFFHRKKKKTVHCQCYITSAHILVSVSASLKFI